MTLCGGLGNQLFQYASARGLAARQNRELILDIHTGFPHDPFRRKYELDRFSISARVLDAAEAWRIRKRHSLQSRIRGRMEKIALERWQRSYTPGIAWGGAGTVHLHAYLQSYKYFPARSILGRELALAHPGSGEAGAYAREIRAAGNATSVHFRLMHGRAPDGAPAAGRIPPPLDRAYYERALDRLQAGKTRLSLFVFSDAPLEDHAWLGRYGDIRRVLYPAEERTAVDDLYLMSQCRHNVISNSTFSWWAAWLNGDPRKTVCAPLKFFPFEKPIVKEDVYPRDWNVI